MTSIAYLRNSDHIFETQDLSIGYQTDIGEVHIEAYCTIKNDQIISDKDNTKYGQLKWVSMGFPRFVEMPSYESPNLNSLFHLQQTEFPVHFQMLTQQDKDVLKTEVKRTKNIDVRKHQAS